MQSAHSTNILHLKAYFARHDYAYAYDDTSAFQLEIYDRMAGKFMKFDNKVFLDCETKQNKDDKSEYCVLRLNKPTPTGEAIQCVFTNKGIAIRPNFQNTGEIDLPTPVFTFADLNYLCSLIEQGLEAPTKETISLIMSCIAILDGAKLLNIKVDKESLTIEGYLKKIESF